MPCVLLGPMHGPARPTARETGARGAGRGRVTETTLAHGCKPWPAGPSTRPRMVRLADQLAQALRQLRSRRDVQLPERLAQVVLHGARADEQLGGDLAVGTAIGREAGDLRLLRRQLVEGGGRPLSCVLAGRLELDPRAL